MRSNFKKRRPVGVQKNGLALWGIGAVALILAALGCQTQLPTGLETGGVSGAVVADFDTTPSSWTTTYPVNTTLSSPGDAGNVILNPGNFSASGSGVNFSVFQPGSGGTAGCAHILGPISSSVLPALFANLDTSTGAGSYYNAGLFTGLQFDLLVAGDDAATARNCQIETAQTVPTPQGSCGTDCYDYFTAAYTATLGQWQTVAIGFASFKQAGWGTPASPAGLTGANLQQAIALLWIESGSSGTGDFYLDQVEFY